MKEITKTSRLAGQLEKIYNKLNADFFDGELTPPVITIQSTPKAYGHYTVYDAWDVKGQGRREINIGAGTLDRPIEETIATLLHEMCHQYANEVQHIQDCSNHGVYHNKHFRLIAESRGLTVTRSEKYGWSHTEPADRLLEWILENDIQDIRLNRNEPNGVRVAGGNTAVNGGTDTTTTAKSHYRRYVCPCCKLIARTTKDANLVCGDCMVPMQLKLTLQRTTRLSSPDGRSFLERKEPKERFARYFVSLF